MGIGLFIAFIGLTSAGLIVAGDGVLIGLGNLKDPAAILAIIGLVITGILLAKTSKVLY